MTREDMQKLHKRALSLYSSVHSEPAAVRR